MATLTHWLVTNKTNACTPTCQKELSFSVFAANFLPSANRCFYLFWQFLRGSTGNLFSLSSLTLGSSATAQTRGGGDVVMYSFAVFRSLYQSQLFERIKIRLKASACPYFWLDCILHMCTALFFIFTLSGANEVVLTIPTILTPCEQTLTVIILVTTLTKVGSCEGVL